jgi:hypothetical protein
MQSKRVRRLAVAAALVFGTGAALGIAPPTLASTARPALIDWQYGGKYPDSFDCTQSGIEFINGGDGRAYRCLEEIDSGGSTAYFNLCLGYVVNAATLSTVRPTASNPCEGL